MRIRRWFVYRDAGAVHIERGAAPDCPTCGGNGWWWTANAAGTDEPDEELCACMFGPRLRIRYRPRRKTAPATHPWLTDEPPF